MEMLGCLGLEAVCRLFSNGDLARSLGVNNASCKLLVDHLASRGAWRGVNRTAVTALGGASAVLAAATVEDPMRHTRNAAFSSSVDPLLGSSANVLTGTPITFGTNGFGLILDPCALGAMYGGGDVRECPPPAL